MVNITVWEWALYVFTTPIAWSCGKMVCVMCKLLTQMLTQIVIRLIYK